MNRPGKVIPLGIIAILLFDLLASLAARRFGFPYARASIGSLIIYYAIGYFASREGGTRPLRNAAIAAAAAGLADASLGLAISTTLGVTPLAAGFGPVRWIGTTMLVIALAAVIGTVGGVVGWRRAAASTAPY